MWLVLSEWWNLHGFPSCFHSAFLALGCKKYGVFHIAYCPWDSISLCLEPRKTICFKILKIKSWCSQPAPQPWTCLDGSSRINLLKTVVHKFSFWSKFVGTKGLSFLFSHIEFHVLGAAVSEIRFTYVFSYVYMWLCAYRK